MKITPIIIPILNVSTLPMDMRRELDSKGLKLENAFSLAEVVGDLDRVLSFGFLISGLSVAETVRLLRPTALKYIQLNHYPATSETVERYDLIVYGTVHEFEGYHPEITKLLKSYKGVVWK